MSIFQNSFFSVAGQKERLSNVVNTLKSSITGKGVQSNTGNVAVDKVLSYSASNPFTTAGVVAIASNPTNALNVVKSGFNSLSPASKLVVGASVPLVASAVVTNPNLIVKAGELPKNVSNLGGNVVNFASNPTIENAKTTFNDNPVLTTAIVGGTAFVVGKGLTGAVATALNTSAVRQNTDIAEKINSGVINPPSVINPMDTTNKYDVAVAKQQTKQTEILSKSPLNMVAQDNSLPVETPISTAKSTKKKKTSTKKKKKVTKKKKKVTKKKKKTVKYKKKKTSKNK